MSKFQRSWRYIVAPLLLCSLFAFSSRLFVSIEKYNKKTLLTALCTIAAAAVNVPLNYIFIKRYGYIAAAYTTAFCYMLLLVIHAAFVRLFIKEDCVKLTKPLAMILVCGVLMGLIMPLYGVKFGAFIRYGLAAALLAGTYLAFRAKINGAIRRIFENISSKRAKNGRLPR